MTITVSSPMKVLLITDNHTQTGGAENYFFDLKARLKKIPGVNVHSLGFGPKLEFGEDYFVLPKTRSNVSKLLWQLTFHPIVYYQLRREIKKFNPDIVHLHNIKQYTPSLLAAIKSYPTVQTIHDYGAVCPTAHNIHNDDYQSCPTGLRLKCFWRHRFKYNPIIYLTLVIAFLKINFQLKKSIKHFFAPSSLLVEYLKKNNFKNASTIIPFKKEKKVFSFDKMNPQHFFFAGNLGSHKGIYLLLDEFAIALRTNPKLTLTIAGSGSEETKLLKKIAALKLTENVFFAGWQKDLTHLYDECAAVIFPSLWMEAFGLVITDAMSHARPVIGSNRGSVPGLIDDQETGLIFDPSKKGDLANKILLLANNLELTKQLGRQAFYKLEEVNNKQILQTILHTYHAIQSQVG